MAISIRLSDLSPRDLDVKDLFDIVVNYKEAIIGTAVELFPSIDADSIRFSLVGINDQSTEAVVESNFDNEVKASSEQINRDITERDFTRTSARTRRALLAISKKTEEKGCGVELFPDTNNRKIFAKLTPRAREALEPLKTHLIEGTTTLFGELSTVGGAEPSCKIRLNDGTLFTAKLSRELAKQIGGKLYEKVSLRGIAAWDSSTLALVTFTVKEILAYRETSTSDAIKAIRNRDPEAWSDVEDLTLTLKEMR